jgi:metal-responsive CopG/Arc/MetJ family transcriptional regulator
MRTTIAIDDDLLEELMQAEHGVSRSEAIRRAVQGYVRKRREDEFMALAGSQLVELDWRKAEQQELDEVRQTGAVDRRKPRGRRR